MRLLSFVLLLFSFSFSASHLITAVSDYTGQYYIVRAPLTVPASDTLVVPAGAIVLFSPFASLTVSGTLVSAGSKQAPVTFSSALDTNGAAAAFDWVGIEVLPGGFCSLSSTFIGFSVSGLTVQDSAAVHLKDCLFSKNGQWSFSVAGKVIDVPEMQPFTYPPPPPQAPSLLPAAPVLKRPSFLSQHKKAVLLVSAAACAAVGTGLLISSRSISGDYYAFRPGNVQYDSMSETDRQVYYDQLQSSYSVRKWSGISCLAASSVFLGFSFIIHK